jgi:hypothetical protein
MLSSRAWAQPLYGDGNKIDLTGCHDAILGMTAASRSGDLGSVEAILTVQAVALNAMFTRLAARATTAQTVEGLEQDLRLALKAQNQCRATCETLAAIKNPPVFARQANIAQGPQQVNNAVLAPPSRTRELPDAPSKLLEAAREPERLDGGTAGRAAQKVDHSPLRK